MNIDNNKDIRFLYLREKSTGNGRGFPIGCICMRIDRNTSTVRYGLSTIHKKEKLKEYDSSLAKELALGRMVLNNKALSLPRGEVLNFHDITWMVFDQLINEKDVPHSSKKAMKRWKKNAEDKNSLYEE